MWGVCLCVCCCSGDSWWKTTAILLACCVRCLISPLFGLTNFFASVAEGFANTLIGDFEQFTRVQERADLDKKHKQTNVDGMRGGDGVGSRGLSGRGGSDVGSPVAHREAPGGASGLAGRFRRGKKKKGERPSSKGPAGGGRSRLSDGAVGSVANNGSILATKTQDGSFSEAYRRASSKQVTFAL